jgi:K+-transporting ATPase ATPase A chain
MVLMFLQFVSAGVGWLPQQSFYCNERERTTDKLGNFYNYFIKSTRILLPLSALVAIALLFSGTPMTLKEKIQLPLYKGDSVAVSVDQQQHLSVLNISEPMADFFGVNSAHPLENPLFYQCG